MQNGAKGLNGQFSPVNYIKSISMSYKVLLKSAADSLHEKKSTSAISMPANVQPLGEVKCLITHVANH